MVFSFDENDPQEFARAERVIKDMLKRGYLLFARVDGKTVRVTEFDAARREYIIADGPEASPKVDDEAVPPATEPKLHGNRGRKRRVPAKGTPVTGVARTAGG
jgi:hypothetical protein